MQRFIAVRVLQSLLAIWVMSLVVFGLVRLSGNPLDVIRPISALMGVLSAVAKDTVSDAAARFPDLGSDRRPAIARSVTH